MTVSFRSQATVLAMFAASVFATYAIAQPGRTGQPPATAQPPSTVQMQQRIGESTQPRTNDASQAVEQFLAQCLITKNQGEVEIAQLAAQRAQNPQVKQFAQQLVQDHQATIQKLQTLTQAQVSNQPDRNVRPAGYTSQEGARSAANPSSSTTARNRTDRPDASGQSNSAQSREAAGSNAGITDPELRELATIERQVAERMQQTVVEKLQAKQGNEFDHCFVGAQVFCHMNMLASLEAISQQTSGQLRQIAQESQPTVKRHLEQAEQLAEQLMKASNRQANLQPSGPAIPR